MHEPCWREHPTLFRKCPIEYSKCGGPSEHTHPLHTLPEPWIPTDGTRSFPGIQKWHKTVSLFKNWNAPKIECAECLCSYNLGKHLPPLCGKRSLFRILPLIWGKDKSVRTFCCECFSSQEGIFSSLGFWMYEKWIFFLNKEFSTKDQQGSWKRWSQSSIPVLFPSHGSSLSGGWLLELSPATMDTSNSKVHSMQKDVVSDPCCSPVLVCKPTLVSCWDGEVCSVLLGRASRGSVPLPAQQRAHLSHLSSFRCRGTASVWASCWPEFSVSLRCMLAGDPGWDIKPAAPRVYSPNKQAILKPPLLSDASLWVWVQTAKCWSCRVTTFPRMQDF